MYNYYWHEITDYTIAVSRRLNWFRYYNYNARTMPESWIRYTTKQGTDTAKVCNYARENAVTPKEQTK